MNNSTVQPPRIYNHESSCSDVVSTLFTVLLSTVSLAAFIGNLLVIVSFVKTQSLRTSTNYYIVNMAVSDLLCACFNWPLYATEGMLTSKVFITEPVASVVCKLGMYFRGISQVVSVLSLVLIAVDRYVAIVYPLKTMLLGRGRIRLTLLVLTWVIPVAGGFPYFLFTKVVKVDDLTFCRIVWDKLTHGIFNVIGFVLVYCAPLIAMSILYTRIVKTVRNRPNTADKTQEELANKRQKQNQKITKILISIVAAFFICWTPLCIYLSLKMFHPEFFVKDKCLVMVALFFYLFPSFSTAINPFILFLFSTNYRQALKNLILQLCHYFKCRLSYTTRRVASSHVEEDNVAMSTNLGKKTISIRQISVKGLGEAD
ncbi:neuromedin-K receptor-like [Oculina patagonica]